MNAKLSKDHAGFLGLGRLRLRSDIVVAVHESLCDGEEDDLLKLAAFASTLGPQAAETPPRDDERPCLRLYAPSAELDFEYERALHAQRCAEITSESDED
jgi:hypothetical protein